MTSLATAIGGMKHWDWCPICRGGLDTGLECDQCGADLMPIYTAFKESLSGGNPGEPKACTGAEERGIVGATGAGQLPDGKPGSTVDSAERRSPDGTERTPSPDESNRHFDRGCFVIMELMQAYERRVRSDCTPEQIEKRPWECAEYLKAAEYLRNVWPPHEPPQPAEATECRYCDEVMKERDDYHEWADTLAYDIERLVGVEIGEHSNLNSPWGNAHDAAEYELDKRARKPHEPGEDARDAARYRWLRERINWIDVSPKLRPTRDSEPFEVRARHWTHVDYRTDPPDSEHIDDYIDEAMRPLTKSGEPT